MHWTVITWLLPPISIAGTFLVIRKRVSGFILWAVSNLGWIVIDWQANLKSQAVLFLVYLFLSIYGIWEWKRKTKAEGGYIKPLKPLPRARWRRR